MPCPAVWSVVVLVLVAVTALDCPDVLPQCVPLLAAPDLTPAVAFANHAVAALPDCIDSFQCKGALLYQLGDLSAAMDAFQAALRINSDAATVHANLALARYHAGYLDGAIGAWETALRLDPSMLSAGSMLAEAYEQTGQVDRSISLREGMLSQLQALSVAAQTEHLDVMTSLRTALAGAYASQGRIQDASTILWTGVQANPALVMRHALSHIPPIPVSQAAIDSARAKTEELVSAAVAKLSSTQLPSSPREADTVETGYYLTYHGVNDEPLRRAIGQMYAHAYPHYLKAAPHLRSWRGMVEDEFGTGATPASAAAAADGILRTPPILHRRIRVAFLSAFFHKHSVSKMISRLVTTLPRSLFHVTIIRFAGVEDTNVQSLRSQVDAMRELPIGTASDDIDRCRAIVTDVRPDVLVYPEIGMHRTTYILAMARLAPVQISTHGNSETSGLGESIDYFASFDMIEDERGDEHYSEQLLRLGGFHSQFSPPYHLASPFRFGASPQQQDGDGRASSMNSASTRTLSHADATDAHLGTDVFEGESAMDMLVRTLPSDGEGGGGVGSSPVSVESCSGGDGIESLVSSSSGTNTNTNPACVGVVETVYLCPQTLYKLHPVFDHALAQVLVQDPCGRVVLLQGSTEAWDVLVVSRVAKQLAAEVLDRPDVEFHVGGRWGPAGCSDLSVLAALRPWLSRLVVAPQRGHNAFLELLAAADVVMDSFPFGGCTSSYEALAMGTLVVSLPSDALRGRFTAAILQQLGFEEYLAQDLDGLVRLAVSVGQFVSGQSAAEKKVMQAEVSAAVRGKCLSQDGPVHDWSAFMLRAVGQHWRWLAERV